MAKNQSTERELQTLHAVEIFGKLTNAERVEAIEKMYEILEKRKLETH